VTPLLAITTSLDHSVILGTSMTGMIAPSIVGMVQHYRMGNVDPRLLVGLVIGTGLGGFLGSKIVVSPDLPSGSLDLGRGLEIFQKRRNRRGDFPEHEIYTWFANLRHLRIL
jgi:hypothetical protein